MLSLINNFCSLQKRLKRQKALLQSISIPTEEKSRFKDCLSVEYMSSEHSVSEDNLDQENSSEDENFPRKRVLCRRPLHWRSQELNNLFLKRDRTANRKQSQRSSSMTIDRRDGSPSEKGTRWCSWIFFFVRKWKLFQSSWKTPLLFMTVILTDTRNSANITALYPSQPMVLFWPNVSLSVLNPLVLLCGFLLYL